MKPDLERVALYLTGGAAVSILFSIAVSQILLALAFAALLFSGAPMRLPPIKLPLALFILGTVIALVLSPDPRSGTPQIRKLYIFLMLLVVYSTFRKISQIRAVILAWAGVEALSAARSVFQFLGKYQDAEAAHQNFYNYYVGARITGFMSHWMTFGGQEMIVLLMLAAFLFFGKERKWKGWGWAGAALLCVSLVMGFTRSIFLLGVPVGLLYLMWFWRRWLVIAAPVAGLAALLSFASVRERMVSVVQPHGNEDSNLFRVITRSAGLQMIEAHPFFGIGPEQVKAQFDRWVPASIHRPLPSGWYGHLHNIYFQYAAERGIPTLLALLWLIGKVLFDFASGLTRRGPPAARFVLHGAIASILAILAEGWYEYNLGDSEVLTMFLVIVAFGYVALRTGEPAPAAQSDSA